MSTKFVEPTTEERVKMDAFIKAIQQASREIDLSSNHCLAVFVSLVGQLAVLTERQCEPIVEQVQKEYAAAKQRGMWGGARRAAEARGSSK